MDTVSCTRQRIRQGRNYLPLSTLLSRAELGTCSARQVSVIPAYTYECISEVVGCMAEGVSVDLGVGKVWLIVLNWEEDLHPDIYVTTTSLDALRAEWDERQHETLGNYLSKRAIFKLADFQFHKADLHELSQSALVIRYLRDVVRL